MSPRLRVVSLNALGQSETNELELYCLQPLGVYTEFLCDS